MMTTFHILVVDDDHRLRALLKTYLKRHNFLVTTAPDTAWAYRCLKIFSFDLVILDVMLPGESGLSFARTICKMCPIPILMLSARAAPQERIEGLEHGAQDYLPKPFEPKELLLRVRNLLPNSPKRELVFGSLHFDLQKKRLFCGKQTVPLTPGEEALLCHLANAPGHVFSREDLARGHPRSVDVQITRLRRKIEKNPRHPTYLRTVRGEGYVLLPDV